jgi:flagellar biosynthetic protein FliP
MTFEELAGRAIGSGLEGASAPPLQIALFLGALALLTAVLVSVTAFTRIVVVLSFVRRALSTQEIPPNQVVIGLALFLTLFVMGPTVHELADDVSLFVRKDIDGAELWRRGEGAIRAFMCDHTREDDLLTFMEMADEAPVESLEEVPLLVLVPAFMISELKTAFIMGFCIYLPFLLIDLVVSTVLMSLGMMMMSPTIVSLPFKILLFVLVDGWTLVVRMLSQSFEAGA